MCLDMADRGAAWPVIHSVGDVVIRAGSVLDTRIIEDYELVYFPEGTGTVYELEGKPMRLDRPCFIFTRPGESHRYLFDPDKNVRHLFVHFDYEALRSGEPRFAGLLRGDGRIPADSSFISGMIRQMLRVANSQPAHWKQRLSGLLTAALEELGASDAGGEAGVNPLPLPIARALAYMSEHLAEPLTIEEIARQSGWSHEHFTRVFAAAVGMSPKRALLERRLAKAEQLLMSGRWTVKQIGYQVGFGDEHHFSKMYKRLRGITASEYIARCRNPLFRHTAAAEDPDTPYALNCHVVIDPPVK